MRMINLVAVSLLVVGFAGVSHADKAPQTWDGLVEVKAKRVELAYLAPGADFRPYTKVMVDPTQVAFHKDWMKNMNQQRDLSRRTTPEEAEKILAAARSNFDDIFHEAFTKAGFTVASAPGPDVLRVATAVINLYVNAPDTMSAGRSRSYTANAGEATLVIEMRDSVTGALMGRIVDQRETRDMGGMMMATSVTNVSDFRALFKNWASISVKGLEALKAASPVPQDLQPGQKLN